MKMSLGSLDMLVAAHESLTTPDSEDWLILPERDTLHVSAFREQTINGKIQVNVHRGTTSIEDFKRLVTELPAKHNLGCASVIIPTDGGKRAREFLAWLTQQSRKGKFNVTAFVGTVTTREAVNVWLRAADLV